MLKKNKVFKKFFKHKSVLNKANFNKVRNTYNRTLQEKKNRVILNKHVKN